MRLEFHPEAETEFGEAISQCEATLQGLGESFADEFARITELILEYPEIGSSVDPEIRKLLLQRFPFATYYSIEAEHVLIVAVAHQRRDPDYWKSRGA